MVSLAFGVVSTAASKAASKCGGNNLPRFSARRRMPAHAFTERKYFGATLGSNISTSEHTEDPSATLGQTEVLSIKSSPSSRIPDSPKLSEDGKEVVTFVGREKSGNILPNEESRLEFMGYASEFIK